MIIMMIMVVVNITIVIIKITMLNFKINQGISKDIRFLSNLKTTGER